MPELEAVLTALWEIAEAIPRVIAESTPEEKATAIVLTILAAIVGAIRSERLRLVLVWPSKQIWRGFLVVLKIPGMSLGLVCRAASGAINGCRSLWGRVQGMRRERLKRRVIAKLRCYEARGELPAEQVAALVQAIALL